MRAVRLWLIFRSSEKTGSVVGFEALSGSVNNISANAEMYGSVLTGYLVDQGAKVDASGLSIRIGVSEDGYVRGDKYVMDSYESRNCNNNLGFVNRGSMELKGTGSVYAFGLDNIGLLNEGTFVCSIGNQYNVKVMNFNAAGENNTALKNTGTIESDFVVEMYGKEIADKTYTNGNCKGIANSGIIRCDTMVMHLSVGRVYLWEDEGKWTSCISDHGIFSFEPMTDSECQGVYGEIEPGVTKTCPGPWWGMGYGHK